MLCQWAPGMSNSSSAVFVAGYCVWHTAQSSRWPTEIEKVVRSVSGSQAVTGTVSSKQIVTRQWLPRIYIVLNLNTKQWHCTAELQGPAARVSSAAVIVLPLEPAPAVRSPNSLPRTHLLQLLPRSSASWDGAMELWHSNCHRDIVTGVPSAGLLWTRIVEFQVYAWSLMVHGIMARSFGEMENWSFQIN